MEGTDLELICTETTGECICRHNVAGVRCEECLLSNDIYYPNCTSNALSIIDIPFNFIPPATYYSMLFIFLFSTNIELITQE